MSEFQEALERIVAGPERKRRVISDAEKAIIAYHEGGHAVVQRILPEVRPGRQGHDHQPRHGPRLHDGPADRGPLPPVARPSSRTRSPGCSAATSPSGSIFGDTTTGASNDIEKATDLARRMVTEFGMSDKLGPLSFGKRDELVFLGREIGEQRNYRDEVAKQIDEEVRAIIDRAYERATEVLDDPPRQARSPWPRSSSPRRPSTRDGFEALFTDLPPKENVHGTPGRSSGPASRSRTPSPQPSPTPADPSRRTRPRAAARRRTRPARSIPGRPARRRYHRR